MSFELRNKCTFCEIKWSRKYLMVIIHGWQIQNIILISIKLRCPGKIHLGNLAYDVYKYKFHIIPFTFWIESAQILHKLRLGFYMCSLQVLSANWLLRQAPDRGTPGAREHITRESPDNGLSHILPGPWGTRGTIMYKVFPRNLYSTECHITPSPPPPQHKRAPKTSDISKEYPD